MSVLAWWILPVVTTVLAVCWAAWVRRVPRPRSDADTVEGFARFRAALSEPAGPEPLDRAAGNRERAPAV